MRTKYLLRRPAPIIAAMTVVLVAGLIITGKFTPLTSAATEQKNLLAAADCMPLRGDPDPSLIIDDFSTGPFESGPIYSETDEVRTQEITSVFPEVTVRADRFRVRWPAYTLHPSTLVVGKNLEHPDFVDTDGLSVANGPRVKHHLEVFYGKNTDGANDPLDLDLGEFSGFRVNFESNDNKMHLHMSYYSASGVRHSGVGRTVQGSRVSCGVDIPFADFERVGDPERSPEPSDVDYIVLQLWPNGLPTTGNDYKISSFGVY